MHLPFFWSRLHTSFFFLFIHLFCFLSNVHTSLIHTLLNIIIIYFFLVNIIIFLIQIIKHYFELMLAIRSPTLKLKTWPKTSYIHGDWRIHFDPNLILSKSAAQLWLWDKRLRESSLVRFCCYCNILVSVENLDHVDIHSTPPKTCKYPSSSFLWSCKYPS